MVLQATAVFGLRWSCCVRSIGLKFIIEFVTSPWLLRIMRCVGSRVFYCGHADAQAGCPEGDPRWVSKVSSVKA